MLASRLVVCGFKPSCSLWVQIQLSSVGRNSLPSEISHIEPNRHTISNFHNFHPTSTQRFPLCTDLPRDLNQGIIKKKILKNYRFISMNTWNTKIHFLTHYHSYFKILLKTINKYIWKNLKTTQVQSLDIVKFSAPEVHKIQAPYKKLELWQFCTRFVLAHFLWHYRMLWSLVSFDARMKDWWHRHYEGKKKG